MSWEDRYAITLLGSAVILSILKLTGLISWSWPWVLAVLWVPIGLSLAGIFVLIVLYVLLTLINLPWHIYREVREEMEAAKEEHED